MIKKVYILSFDSSLNLTLLHNAIVSVHSVGQISNWSKHLTNSYLLVSSLSAFELNKTIGDKLEGLTKKYLIVEVNLNNYNGWMPSQAWEWIKAQKATLNNPFL